MRHWLGILALGAVFAGAPALAQQSQQMTPASEGVSVQTGDPVGADGLAADAGETVSITADDLEITEDANSALFTGNVEIDQGGMTMTAGRVDVLYGAGGPSDIVSFTASGGRVRMVTEDQTIDGDQAVYDFEDRILVFTGNVVVNNPSGRVESARLVIDTRAGTSSFTGGADASDGRVTGVFTPGSQ